MKQFLTALFLLFALISNAQFRDTSEAKKYIRENIRDKRPDKITATQLSTSLLGIASLITPSTTNGGDFNVVEATTSITLTLDDCLVLTSNSITISLPKASDSKNKIYYFKTGGNPYANVTIQQFSGEKINKSTQAYSLSGASSLALVSNGVEWFVLFRGTDV
ncbi:hypothetical protein LX64_04190 [Chitinophaga skermanii]|uniref:Uncharacterized protein n=1 Tax=Chitinophaga skermanii TaxID=331697 RepID=A0A327Q9C7_9BACT|nr:hypothetical protein [Chitinophaga skermanii]RAJ00484.1 hypothetical protein LX64_04190 [Chitinophaga skermanii]